MSHEVHVFSAQDDFESEIFVEKEVMKWDVREVAKGFREEFIFWERKQRGLEKADAVFEYLEEPQGFAELWEKEDYMKCKESCIGGLKELVNKRRKEKTKLIYYVNLGKSCERLKEFKNVFNYYTKAYSILGQVLIEKDALFASLSGLLADLLKAQGDYQTALKFHTSIFDMRKMVYGEEHPQTALSYHDLALVYACLKEFQKALEYHAKAFDIIKSKYGEVHFETANSYVNLASAYDETGDYQKGLELKLKALEIRKSLYGEIHPLITDSYMGLASSYESLNQNETALEYNLKALDIRKHIDGENHQEIAILYQNLAYIYNSLKDYDKAADYYLKAIDVEKSIYGETRASIAAYYSNLASIYETLYQDEAAIGCRQKVIEIKTFIYGEKHEETAKSHQTLASLFHRFIHGDKHEDTAGSYRQVAKAYAKLEDYQRAIQYSLKARDIYVSLLRGNPENTIVLQEELIKVNRSVRFCQEILDEKFETREIF